MQHKNVFLLDTCFWLISAIIIYLIYPIIYCIIWAIKLERKMKIDDRLNKMSKEQLIDMIKEIKLICDSNKSVESPIRNTLHFILKLIKGYHYEDKNV